MDLGLVLQTTPPSARVVDLAKRAETYGFTHVWTFDSHILWQEPYVIYSQILAETRNVVVGPMVTNPATRDWTVTASRLRHAQRDVRQPHGVRHRPGRLGGARHQRQADDDRHAARVGPRHPRAGQRAQRRVQGLDDHVPVGGRSSELEVWVAGYGPRALALAGEVGDGFILQLADPQIVGVDDRRRARGRPSEPGATPTPSRSASPPRPTSATTSPTCATSAAGSAGWSATTSPTSSGATATRPTCRPRSPSTSRAARATTTTSTARPATPTPTSCPTRSSTASASSGRSTSTLRRLHELARPRRRPVRHLPPARRQGRHPAGLRRARHPRQTRRQHGRAKT